MGSGGDASLQTGFVVGDFVASNLSIGKGSETHKKSPFKAKLTSNLREVLRFPSYFVAAFEVFTSKTLSTVLISDHPFSVFFQLSVPTSWKIVSPAGVLSLPVQSNATSTIPLWVFDPLKVILKTTFVAPFIRS